MPPTHHRRQTLLAAGAVLALLTLAGCSSSKPSTPSTPSPAAVSPSASASATGAPSPTAATGSASAEASPSGSPSTAVTVTIKDFAYSPVSVTVTPGATVTVINQDDTTHTVTSVTDGAFDTGDIPAGKTTTFTAPTQPGDYRYICSIHTYMHGTLTVQ